MNEQFYTLASELDNSELNRNMGTYFRSIIGTFNHIVVGDITWLKRFAQHPLQCSSLEFVRNLDQPDSLDAIVHDDFSKLRGLRLKLDDCIVQYIQEIDENVLSSNLTYSKFKGEITTKVSLKNSSI